MKEDCILIEQKCYEHKFLLFIALPFAAHGSSLYKNKMTIFLQFLRSFEDAISNVVAMAVLVLQSQGIYMRHLELWLMSLQKTTKKAF